MVAFRAFKKYGEGKGVTITRDASVRSRLVTWNTGALILMNILLLSNRLVSGDVLDMSAGQSSLQFVNVGSPGNAADPNAPPWIESSIGYSYSIGKCDVTNAQYAQFLNAVATTGDPYGVYNGGYIDQTGSPGAYSYSVATANQNFPVNWVTWGDAARFVNWLNNGQPTGPEGPTTTETGAYGLNGGTTNGDLLATARNPNAKFVLPTIGEWYKASYYDPTTSLYFNYPTGTNSSPLAEAPPGGSNSANYDSVIGGPSDVGAYVSTTSPFGAYDMMGNVLQWTETQQNGNFYREVGSSYDYFFNVGLPGSLGDSDNPTTQFAKLGFRVASVPEPGQGLFILFLLYRAVGTRRQRAFRTGP